MEEAMPAGMTLPRELEIYPSQTDSKRIGIYSKYTIKKGVKYGPYKGVRKKIQDVTDHSYSWEIVSPSRKPICLIDASDVMKANWLRFVKSARFYEEQNMIATQLKKNIFYKVIKDIYPGDELLCWFNNSGDVSCNHLEGANYSKADDEMLNKSGLVKDTEDFKRPAEVKKMTKYIGSSKVESNYNRKSNLKVRKRKLIENKMKGKKVKKIEKESLEADSDMMEEESSHQIPNNISLAEPGDETSEAESTKESKIAAHHDSTMPVLEKNVKSSNLGPLDIAKDHCLPDTSLTMQLSPPLLSPILSEQTTQKQNSLDKTDVDFNIQTPDVSSTNDVKQATVTQNYSNVFQIGPEDQIRDKRGRPFYKCKVCGGIFSKQVGLKIHYRKNHLARKHRGFSRPVKIAHPREKIRTRSVSVTEVVTKRKQAIKMWDDQYDSFDDLDGDLDTKTTPEASGSAKYRCPYCDKQFRYSGWMERHVLQHNVPSSKQIACPDCPRTFLSYNHFRAHLPLHGKIKRKKAKKNLPSKCNLVAQYSKKLETQFQEDGLQTKKLKKLQCDVCGKRFHTRSNCIRHRRLVHNIRIKRRRKENGQQDYFIEKGTIRSKGNASRMKGGSSVPSGDGQQQTITAIPEDTPSIAAIFGLSSEDPASSEESNAYNIDNQSKQWINEEGLFQENYSSIQDNLNHNLEKTDEFEELNTHSIQQKDVIKIPEVSHGVAMKRDNVQNSSVYAESATDEPFNKQVEEESYLRDCLTNPTVDTAPMTTLKPVHVPDGSSTLRRVLSSSCTVHGQKASGKRVVSSYQTRFYNAVAASPWSQVNAPQPYIPRKRCDKLSEDDSQVLNLAVRDKRKSSESVLDLTSTQKHLQRTSYPMQGQCRVHPRGITHSQSFQPKNQRSNLPPPYNTNQFRMSMPSRKHGVNPLSPSARVIFPGMNPEHVHSLNTSINKMTAHGLQTESVGQSHSNFPANLQHGVRPRYHHPGPRSVSPSNPVDLMTNRFYGNVRQSTPRFRPRSLPPPSLPPFAALNQSTRMQPHSSGVLPVVPNVHLSYEMPKNSQPKTVKEILEERAASKKQAIDKIQTEHIYHQAPNPQLNSPVSISPQPNISLPNQLSPNVPVIQQPQNLSIPVVPVPETQTDPFEASENSDNQIPAPAVLGDNSKTISTFKCNVCEAPFNSMKDLTQHVIIHAKEWNYKCEFCIRLFKDPKDLVEHRSTLHRVGKMYACSVCQREFAYLSNLQTHQRDCHANVQCSYTELGPDELRPINFTVPVQVTAMSPSRDQPNVAKSRISQISEEVKKKSPLKIRQMGQLVNYGKDSSPMKNQSPRKLTPVNPQRHHPFAHHRKLGFLNMMTNQRYESVRNDSMNTCTKCGMVFLDKVEFHKHIMECASVTTTTDKPTNLTYGESTNHEHDQTQSNAGEDLKDTKTLDKKHDTNSKKKSMPDDKDIYACFGCSKVFNAMSALERHKKKCPYQDKTHEVYEPNNVTTKISDQHNLIKEQHSCPYCKRNFCYMKSLKKHAIICPQRVDNGDDPLQLIEDAQRKVEETKLKEVSFRKSIHNPFNKAYADVPTEVNIEKSSTQEGSAVKIRIRKRSNSGKKHDYVIENHSKTNINADEDNDIEHDGENAKHDEEIKSEVIESKEEVVQAVSSECDQEDEEAGSKPLVIDDLAVTEPKS